MSRYSCYLCCFILLLSSACAFRDLEKDLLEFDKTSGLTGQIQGDSLPDTSIIVALYKLEKQGPEISQYLFADKTRHFSFIVSDGEYYLSAFEDGNYNLIHDDNESYGSYGNLKKITVNSSDTTAANIKTIRALDIQLNPDNTHPSMLVRDVTDGEFVSTSFKKLGVVTDFDDPLFAQKNASLGYWQPLSFIKKFGSGIYFLEPYDPEKIPVLFVHGGMGTPVGWQEIIKQMDRERYQPWLYYYPSGFRLDLIADALNNMTEELHDKYQFKELHLIAHSLGGLVSRAFILQNMLEHRQHYIKKFISISTPWGGISSAAKGVKYAPTAVPSWLDIVPDSEFIEDLYKNSLPDGVDFSLLFGVRGKCSLTMGNNDGTVEIGSEIDYRAQEEASGFYGFDEDHMSILSSDKVIQQIITLLEAEE